MRYLVDEIDKKRAISNNIIRHTMSHSSQAMNKKLENMSEHYDIPKVSWTK